MTPAGRATPRWPDACRRVLADALGRPHRRFPTELGDRDTAASLLSNAGFIEIEHHEGTVRWTFRDLDDAIDDHLVLDDPDLITAGLAPIAISR
ncbi:MAG: hypothetical protein AAGA37_12065 [Actinomycetota bacterium]